MIVLSTTGFPEAARPVDYRDVGCAFSFWRGTSPNYTPKRSVYLPALQNSPYFVCKSRVGWFATSPFPRGLHRPTSEILQRRFRVLLHQAGKSEGWSSGNFRQ